MKEFDRSFLEMNITATDYFQRQSVVAGIGTAGLEQLREARVAVVGVGGVGATIAEFLARSGVGFLRLIDQDIVEPSNLHRLIGLGPEHAYHPKSEVVAQAISRRNPWVQVDPVVETLRLDNLVELLEGIELIVDGLDNFRTRYYLNRYSRERQVPYIFTSAIATQGHVGVFSPPATSCLECRFESVVNRPEDSCEVLGITPTVIGVIGAIAADEAVKTLLGLSTTLRGGLLTVDTMGPDFLFTQIPRRDGCKTCAGIWEREVTNEETLTTLCGEKTFNIIPPTVLNLDLHSISQSIAPDKILADSDKLIAYRKDNLLVSLFKTGRILVSGADGEREALGIARDLWSRVSPENRVLLQYS